MARSTSNEWRRSGGNSVTSCSRHGSSSTLEPAPTPGGGSRHPNLDGRCHRGRSRSGPPTGSVARRRFGRCHTMRCSKPRPSISHVSACEGQLSMNGSQQSKPHYRRRVYQSKGTEFVPHDRTPTGFSYSNGNCVMVRLLRLMSSTMPSSVSRFLNQLRCVKAGCSDTRW